MARTYGNMQPPSQPRETRNRQTTGAPSRVATKEQPVPKGSWYRKPEVAPEKAAPSGKRSSPKKKPAVARNAAPTDQKTTSSSSKATPPGKLHKHWQTTLTSNTDQAWSNIYDDPYAVLNKLPSSGGSRKAQESATTANQVSASPVPSKKPITQSGQNVTSKDTAASLEDKFPAKATATAVKDDVDDEKDVVAALSDVKLAEDKDDGMATKTEEHGTGVSHPTIDFGEDLIWLGD